MTRGGGKMASGSMKTIFALFLVLLLAVSGCAAQQGGVSEPAGDDSPQVQSDSPEQTEEGQG